MHVLPPGVGGSGIRNNVNFTISQHLQELGPGRAADVLDRQSRPGGNEIHVING